MASILTCGNVGGFSESAFTVMSNSSNSRITNPPNRDEKAICRALISAARRKMLFALAVGGPKTAADLAPIGRGAGICDSRRGPVSATLKNIKVLIDAGLVIQLENPQDRRRCLYGLAPGLNVTVKDGQAVFDFDFLVARLSADGN